MNNITRNIRRETELPLFREINEWEKTVSSMEGFHRLDRETSFSLSKLLSSDDEPDSYLTSSAYYEFTGRKGLWLFQFGNTFVPLCWHPNQQGKIIVFPARGEKDPNAILKLCEIIPIPPNGLRLVRVKKDQTFSAAPGTIKNRSISFVPVLETILDWKFPVRVLSTQSISELKSSGYMYIRNRIQQTKKYKIEIEDINSESIGNVVGLIYRWANRPSNTVDEIIDLISPYRVLIKMFEDGKINLNGLIIKIDGQIQGIVAWEISNKRIPTANIYINICNISCKGLSELMIKSAAEALLAQGIAYLNLGGSETEGLDHYKKKFLPAFSIDLQSVEVVIEETKNALYSAAVLENESQKWFPLNARNSK